MLKVPANKNIKLILNYVAAPLLFGLLFFIVYRQIHQQHNWKEALLRIRASFSGRAQWKWWMVVLLMLSNWGLEAVKWRIAIRSLLRITFWRSFQAILAGVTVSSFTPNRVGEYFGRMIFIEEGKRAQSISPTVLCSFAQMIITLLAGTIGLYAFDQFLSLPSTLHHSWIAYLTILRWMSALSFILLLTIYLRFAPLVTLINRFLSRYSSKWSIPAGYPLRDLCWILFYSAVRYAVFVLQYALLFSLFGISLSNLEAFTGVSVMFVVMAIVPTLTFITDLGVRWEAGIQVFGVFSGNSAGIFAVSLGIWLINLIIPALIGSLLILRTKLFSSR